MKALLGNALFGILIGAAFGTYLVFLFGQKLMVASATRECAASSAHDSFIRFASKCRQLGGDIYVRDYSSEIPDIVCKRQVVEKVNP